MHSRILKAATRQYLQMNWSLDGGGEVKVTPPPGKPLNMQGAWAITIHDGPQTFESKLGFYARHGCVVTFSSKLDGAPPTELEDYLDAPPAGFSDARDALAAFLHKRRWEIANWANILADANPVAGVVTQIVEAPRPVNESQPTPRGPDWWGQAVGRVLSSAGSQEEARICGYSVDIPFGQAKTMQTESPTER